MSLPSFLLGEKKKTASVAKERLQIILAHERSGRGAAAPDYLPALQRDLVAVISQVRQDQSRTTSRSTWSARTTSRCSKSRSSCPTRCAERSPRAMRGLHRSRA